MKYRKRLNKIYDKILYDEKDNTPYFIEFDHSGRSGYFVYKTINDIKKHFKTLNDAKTYIENINPNALILIIDFHHRKR